MNLDKKKTFDSLCSLISIPKQVDIDYLFDLYNLATEGIDSLIENQFIKDIRYRDDMAIINYCIGEIVYSCSSMDEAKRQDFLTNEDIKIKIASVVVDKYLTSNVLNIKKKTLTNRFLPPISSLDMYLNFMNNILESYSKNEPSSTLIVDILNEAINLCRCILELLVRGYETSAMAAWRTLHECECTLTLIDHHGKKAIDSYLKHMKYSIVFKKGAGSDEKTNEVFEQIKQEMREHNLKSKDMKKYIEYGWLYCLLEPSQVETFKLNFRDGLEKVAGLKAYSSLYEQSSEIVHSTPMLFYSNRFYYHQLALLTTYESFFRIEEVFNKLFISKVNCNLKNQYLSMRNNYYQQLLSIHQKEMRKLRTMSKIK